MVVKSGRTVVNSGRIVADSHRCQRGSRSQGCAWTLWPVLELRQKLQASLLVRLGSPITKLFRRAKHPKDCCIFPEEVGKDAVSMGLRLVSRRAGCDACTDRI